MKIKKLRLKFGLSQAELAKRLNISQSNYSKYERGDLTLDAKLLIKLSECFGCSIDYLLEHKTNDILYLSDFTSEQQKIIAFLQHLNKTNTVERKNKTTETLYD